MDKYFLLKCLISFFIGIITYKLLLDISSYNLLEGQEEQAPAPELEPAPPIIPPPQPPGDGTLPPSITSILNEVNTKMFNGSPLYTLKEIITNINSNLDSDKIPDEIPDVFDNIQNFHELGSNTLALDYIELLIRTISTLDKTEFETLMINMGYGIDNGYCEDEQPDLNDYIMVIMLLQYQNIGINDNEFMKISNRLSKHIPDILDKIQNYNKSCPENKQKHKKSILVKSLFYKLFKNNQTIITFTTIRDLINDLSKMDKVYGVVMLLCLTYIIVKFMGMFNMKIDV
uniref:Uncharacterized protein n=1 Tax=viral metagenome TaxID=1070528 RepID=A0A6C0C6X9_9ZZZZ